MILRDVKFTTKKKQLVLETPDSLLQTAWLNIILPFRKPGRENMREMTADDFQIHKSSSGLEYITLVERATKNHQGGLNSSENEAASVMSEMLGNPRCPVLAVKSYLSKRNKQCQVLWQKPPPPPPKKKKKNTKLTGIALNCSKNNIGERTTDKEVQVVFFLLKTRWHF